ncbi:hypothetical protein PPNSA23_43870 [Phyllobacterium phragmitis]|uniref:Transposase DDE domain-containing protein n=1 Tax=Phyllobacterium phragmitis TaxID=2670329 RepID=A0ABQ0H694_9HYPH
MQVFGNAQRADHRQFLMDKANTCRNALRDGGQANLPSIKFDPASIRLQSAGENVHERRFTSTVLAQKSDYLSRIKVKVHGMKDAVAAETLGNAARADKRRTRQGADDGTAGWKSEITLHRRASAACLQQE